MLTRTIFAVVLFAVLKCCHAQPLPVISVAPPSSSSIDSLLPSGMYLRWNWKDLSSTPVSIWVDRIQGWSIVQATGGNQPSWSLANGVQFNGTSSFMVSSNMMNVADTEILVIGQFDSTAANHQMLNGGNVASGTYIGIAGIANALRDNNNGDGFITPINTGIYDFISTKTAAANAYQFYTNGVISQFVNQGAAFNGSAGIIRLGSTTTPDRFLQGKIWEIIVWTNQTWNSTTVSNVHHYATNVVVHAP